MSKTIVGWICPLCDMNNYSNYELKYPECSQCKTKFNWTRVGFRDAVERVEKELGWKWTPSTLATEAGIEKDFFRKKVKIP